VQVLEDDKKDSEKKRTKEKSKGPRHRVKGVIKNDRGKRGSKRPRSECRIQRM
jgi:hypothetical protein